MSISLIPAVLCTALITLATCGQEEPGRKEMEEQGNETLFDNWSLIEYSPGFGPLEAFGEESIIWTISRTKINVKINVQISSQSRIPYKTSGEYNITFSGTNDILISNETYKSYLKDNKNTLILDAGSAHDGPRITFKRSTKE